MQGPKYAGGWVWSDVNGKRVTAIAKSHSLSLPVMMLAGEACLPSCPQAVMTKQSITSRHQHRMMEGREELAKLDSNKEEIKV
jgi:hypothetical protein